MKCREIGSNPFQCRDAYFGWKEWKKFRHNFVNPAFSAFLSWAAAMLCCHAQPITTTFLKRRITLYRCSCDAKKCLGGCQHLRMPVYTAWNGKIFFTFDFWEIFEIHWHIFNLCLTESTWVFVYFSATCKCDSWFEVTKNENLFLRQSEVRAHTCSVWKWLSL